jgi:IclR family transcriptional regulator, pca regulon regulatory protein
VRSGRAPGALPISGTVFYYPDIMATRTRTETGSGQSQSLERGLAILSAFKPATPELGISELARFLGLTRSTSHRYVATLARLGYLQQNPQSRKYRLGPRVLDLGFSAINSMELRQIAATHLQQLSDETGHTVNMAILDGTDIVYIERCRSSQQGQREIDLNLHVGSRLPAYCTSMGKVLLAGLPEPELADVLDKVQFQQRGPNTLVERRALVDALAAVRDAGIAVNNEELAYGLRSIAVPVRDNSGGVVAAINLAVHRSLVSMEDLVIRLSPALKRTANEISARIGYRPAAA